MEHNSLIEAIKVGHKFDYSLFDDLSLSLNRQETIAILGVSGSGKSTLLHILASFIKPNSGKILFENQDIYALSPKDLEDFRREKLGIIFQHHYLFRGFSAKENLIISSYLSENEIDTSLLASLGIDTLLEKNVSDLSGGQQQRVSVARVLTKKPRVIFADEPTGNLDKATASDVMQAIFSYIQENRAGMFLVTHDEQLARECDRVYLLEDRLLKEL